MRAIGHTDPTGPVDRLPPLPEAQWTEAQRREAQAIIAGPRGALVSPFVPLLRSPELMGHAQRMGEYLRYRSALPLRLSELAILAVARHWSQAVEWAIHAPIAQAQGVAAGTIAALAEGRPPQALPEDEAALLAFCDALQRTQQVDDACWQRALQAFGEAGVVDLIGLVGYYSLLAMVMNAARTPAPPGPVLPAARSPMGAPMGGSKDAPTDAPTTAAPTAPPGAAAGGPTRAALPASNDPARNWFDQMRAGLVPPAPVSRLLGATVRAVDTAAGTLAVDYQPQPSFANPAGTVQGGILGAMLDDLCASLVDATLRPGEAVATLNLNLSFLRGAGPQPIQGKAWLQRRGREVCHVSAELWQGGQVVASAVATCRVLAGRA